MDQINQVTRMRRLLAVSILNLFACLTGVAAQELVTNGSFEQMVHNFPAGWSRTEDENNRAAATWSIDEGPDSAHALKIERTLDPAPASRVTGAIHVEAFQRGIALYARQKYTLTFQAKALGTANESLQVRIDDVEASGPPPLAATVSPTSEWRKYRLEFMTTADVLPENFKLTFTFASKGTLWLDDVSLAGGDSASRAETAVPKFQPRLPALGSKNLVPNGSFECGADGWLSLGKPLRFGGNIAGLYGSVEAGPASDGTQSYRLTLGAGSTPQSYFDCWPPEQLAQSRLLTANRGWIEVEKGRPYTLSADMRSDRPGITGVLQFNFNGDARKNVQPMTKEVVLTENWQRYSYTVVAPDDGVFVAVGPDVSKISPSTPVTFRADAVQLEAGETATPFEANEPVTLGFNSGRYGNVYSAGAPVVINVSGSNVSAAPVNVMVSVRLTDYWDRPLPALNISLTVPAHGRINQPVPLQLSAGFFRVRFSWVAGGRGHSRTLPLAVIEPYAHADSPFGLNHGPTTAEACRQIKLAGITWVRDWSVNWEWAEPEPGKLSFATIDPHIARLQDAGMNILSLLPSNPSTAWASEAPASVPNRLWYRLAYAPREPKLLFDFVAKAAAHYKSSVGYWEFLNEPLWVPDFCLPKKGNYTVGTYLSLLKGASAAIRSANPGAKVIGGIAIQSEIPFGDEFIKAGGLAYVDILNLHPYAGVRAPETFVPDMERIHRAMKESGTTKPIWATEAGYYGLDEFPSLPWSAAPEDFAGNRLLMSEQQCGDYLVRFSTIMLAHGVEKIFWHEPVTGDANDARRDVENVFIGPDAMPRKTYVASSAMARMLGPKPVFSTPWVIPEEGERHATTTVRGYAFAGDNQAVLIAWDAGPASGKNWGLKLPSAAAAADICGAPLAGKVVRLSGSPIYITSRTLTAQQLAQQCGLVAQ
ncbi:MAG: hypothetical protein JWM88_1367 [Verrucomicrobia bacterium]|nr:hypothetical protein [Verrucomicrobiota bacterium]